MSCLPVVDSRSSTKFVQQVAIVGNSMFKHLCNITAPLSVSLEQTMSFVITLT